jgi:hypothetical protein
MVFITVAWESGSDGGNLSSPRLGQGFAEAPRVECMDASRYSSGRITVTPGAFFKNLNSVSGAVSLLM